MPDVLHNMTRDAEPAVLTARHLPSSPHLLDLDALQKAIREKHMARAKKSAPRGLGVLAHILDERIHLRDLRHRRVSTHHMDWRDFPPLAATGLRNAVRITARRFINEHPYADLTVVTLAAIAATVAWKAVMFPAAAVASFARGGAPTRASTEESARRTAARIAAMRVAKEAAPVAASVLEAPAQEAATDILTAAPATTTAPKPFAIHAPAAPASRAAAVHARMGAGPLPYLPMPVPAKAAAPITVVKSAAPARSPFLALIEDVVANVTPVKPAFALPIGWTKRAASAFMVAALFVLPISAYAMLGGLRSQKSAVMDEGMSAVSHLKSAAVSAQARDFAATETELTAASAGFAEARRRMGALGTLMNAAADALPVNTAATSAMPLLITGEEATSAGATMVSALGAMKAAKTPVEKLRVLSAAAREALPHMTSASAAISKIDDGIVPPEYRDRLTQAREELPKFTGILRGVVDASGAIETILGGHGERRYLVLFQNDSELRPTGGFIGSFALVDVKDGEVVNMNVPGGGSYDLQGSLGLKLSAPQPLHLINPVWQFQDANWYPDFPTSAAQLSRFYEKSGGPTVDGVIAVNASFMETLLAVTGPVEMPEYGKTITAQNFFYETQKQVEQDYDKTANKPKQFIADLAPKMLARVTGADDAAYMGFAGAVADALRTKDIQFWLRDADLEQKLAAYGWDGAIPATDGDFLGIVHTNIAGQKTDLAMSEKVTHTAKVLGDGSVIDTLTVSRTHTGQKGALFSGVRNVDWLRVYVPKGGELVEARGFTPPDPKLFKMSESGYGDDATISGQEKGMTTDRDSGARIFEENGKTVFAGWVQTDPGDTSVVTFAYRLPPGTAREDAQEGLGSLVARARGEAKRTMRYGLTVWKQPGETPPHLTSVVSLPKGFGPESASPARTRTDDGYQADATLDGDLRYDLVASSQ
ncbi:MAG: hypothetical protein RLZZ324_1059 [Candidatus Parcubacteria bacterium]